MKPPYFLVPFSLMFGQAALGFYLPTGGSIVLIPFATYVFLRSMRWAVGKAVAWETAQSEKEYAEHGTIGGRTLDEIASRPFLGAAEEAEKRRKLRVQALLIPAHGLVLLVATALLALYPAWQNLNLALMLVSHVAVQVIGRPLAAQFWQRRARALPRRRPTRS